MNVIGPQATFAAGEPFHALVARAFAAEPMRHTRDRLLAEVQAGHHASRLLRAGEGLGGLSQEAERRAAINSIDFAFEALVMPGLSLPQAAAYCEAAERLLPLGESAGLDHPGPLWIDTVHHACVFSVLFQLATRVARTRPCERFVLLHQGERPEPRLGVVATLAARRLGVEPVSLPLRGQWFRDLARLATPRTVILALADMPALAFPAGRQRRAAEVDLHAESGLRRRVDVVSGSATFARRIGASHLVLDYPEADRLRLAPFDPTRPPACPLIDWVFWPILVGGLATAAPTLGTSMP